MKNKSKSPKRKTYFIVKFPDGEETLIKCNSWAGLVPYSKYIKDEYCDDTAVISIRKWEALKFLLKGMVFNVSK